MLGFVLTILVLLTSCVFGSNNGAVPIEESPIVRKPVFNWNQVTPSETTDKPAKSVYDNDSSYDFYIDMEDLSLDMPKQQTPQILYPRLDSTSVEKLLNKDAPSITPERKQKVGSLRPINMNPANYNYRRGHFMLIKKTPSPGTLTSSTSGKTNSESISAKNSPFKNFLDNNNPESSGEISVNFIDSNSPDTSGIITVKRTKNIPLNAFNEDDTFSTKKLRTNSFREIFNKVTCSLLG